MDLAMRGGLVIGSANFEVGPSTGAADRRRFLRIAEVLAYSACPFMVGADWKAVPQAITDLHIPQRVAAAFVAPKAGT